MRSNLNLILNQQRIMWETAETIHGAILQNGAMIMNILRKHVPSDERDQVEQRWGEMLASIREVETKLKPPIIGYGLELILREWASSQEKGTVQLEYYSTVQMESCKLGIFYQILQGVVGGLPENFNLNIDVSDFDKSSNQICFQLEGAPFIQEKMALLNVWAELIREIGTLRCEAMSVTLIM